MTVFLNHVVAVVLVVLAIKPVIRLTRKPFERNFRDAHRKGGLILVSIGFMYFFLPMLFSVTGVGLFIAPNPSIHQAIKDLSSAPQELPGAEGIVTGAILASALTVAIARLLTVVYHPFMVRTLYFYTLASLAFFVIMCYLNPQYIELIFEHVFNRSSIWLFFLAGIITGTVTELLIETGVRSGESGS